MTQDEKQKIFSQIDRNISTHLGDLVRCDKFFLFEKLPKKINEFGEIGVDKEIVSNLMSKVDSNDLYLANQESSDFEMISRALQRQK